MSINNDDIIIKNQECVGFKSLKYKPKINGKNFLI